MSDNEHVEYADEVEDYEEDFEVDEVDELDADDGMDGELGDEGACEACGVGDIAQSGPWRAGPARLHGMEWLFFSRMLTHIASIDSDCRRNRG